MPDPSGRVWIVAYRGASTIAPENTLSAFELAIESGADVIEADVRLSADGEPLILHDATVDRTTNGTGLLADLTADAASELDAGDGERIPALAELLALAVGRVRLSLDLREVEAADAAVASVQAAGMVETVSFASLIPEACDRVSELSPESAVVQLVDSAAALAQVVLGNAPSGVAGSRGVGAPGDIITEDVVEICHRRGVRLFAHVVDDADEMRRLVEAGVDGITTRLPGVLAGILRR